MSDHPHSLLIDLLAAHDSACAHGCALEPRLLELLVDRHAAQAGALPLGGPIRTDGPRQRAPIAMARIGQQPNGALDAARAHVRR